MEMLRRVPCFTNAELPSKNMLDFFPLTKRILVNMGNDLPVFVLARLPFGTPESAIPVFSNCRIARFRRLQKW